MESRAASVASACGAAGVAQEEQEGGRTARYVAVIADGHRRWATSRGVSVIEGHRAGMDTVVARVYDALDLGVCELTMFAFSTENWRRPADEVDGLTLLAAQRIAEDCPRLARRGVHLRFIGTREGLPPRLIDQMRSAEDLTASNAELKLFLAFNYGGRREIEDAAAGFAQNGGRSFADCLYAPDMHDPDVLIRTGGDKRLSNFMLWRLAYTELVFRDEFWPDFTRECFEASLAEFASRRRRFGGS
jgi:undecaprenyl diphosphate synthase